MSRPIAPGDIEIPRNCEGCPYKDGPAVGTRGPVTSRIALVGEAPGVREIADRKPFVGNAGGLLAGAARDAGLGFDRLFITNSVACRPYPTPRPSARAIDACRARLISDLSASPRDVIVTLGTTAFRAATEQRVFRLADLRGRVHTSRWGRLIPTLHPARVLRIRSERDWLVSDLAMAGRLLTESS
jgi:DNA polymerase